MGMVVRTNTMAMNANRQLSMNNSQVAKSLEKLSSGFRINRAADDASGLAISEKMKAQIKGLEQASANSQDGISLIQTAEGGLTEVHNMLNRMVELATKSANGTIRDDVDREAIQTEVDALNTEITRISKATNFNGINLLDGSLGGGAPSVKAVIGGQVVSGKGTDAVAFTGKTAAVVAGNVLASVKFNDVDGNSVEIKMTADAATGTAQNLLDGLKAKDADAYAKLTAAYDVTANADQTITFTAKNPGANGKVEWGVAATGGAPTSVAIAGATAGSNAKTEFTLGANMANGDSITVGGKTYTMAAAKNDSKREFTSLAELQAQMAADGGYTIASSGALADGDTLTISATKAGKGLTLQIGDTNDDFNKVTVSVGDMSAAGIGTAGLNVSDQDAAGDSIDVIKAAINQVSTNRANLGALQNRLEYTINNLDTTAENMNAANSRIRDTDMAKEMMNYTKMNILTQAAQAMLAQANQQPQAILQLLQ
ncbi:flagellin [Agathobaculum sp. NTUH-O15-33]|uniref:flagellin N-terminal helical domain-containing protein n=1 Tax=Agathobaculum sp. NTUH-O15-33 TaxID=3079302 RepID=UPI002958CF55|nr:flagellin [Agathobaculum sp. NTUH-O15-33]WNX84827.1 flagellin [Agathobaculum sp. NTUH-O15-33]